MRKIAVFVAFLMFSLFASGLLGVAHDQISYTVSNEYFTKFKFIQFHLLDSGVPERIRAAQVGFFSSWWMGLPLGLLAGAAGFIHTSASQMRRALFLSLPVIVGFTLAFALLGLAYGAVQTVNLELANYAAWFVPQGLEQPRRFICAGYMHNAAYLGGVAAIPASWLFHVWYRRHAARAA